LRPRAVDELVRGCGFQLLTIPRYAAEDGEIDGTSIRQGDRTTGRSRPPTVTRGPRVFADPDRLDITRTDTTPGHLGFAHGPHFSLGAPLARVQTEITVVRAADALPRSCTSGGARGDHLHARPGDVASRRPTCDALRRSARATHDDDATSSAPCDIASSSQRLG